MVVIFVHLNTNGHPLAPDAWGYQEKSNFIAAAWAGGHPLSPAELAALTGTQQWGFNWTMAVARQVGGGSWLAAKLVIGLIAASAGPAAYLLVKSYSPDSRRAIIAGLGIAASPSLLYWDASGLKDGLIVAIVLWIVVVQVRTPPLIAVIVSLAGMQALLYVRPPAALFVLAGLAALFLHRRAALLIPAAAVAAIGATILIAPRAHTLLQLSGSLMIDPTTPLSWGGGTESTSLLLHPQHLGWFFFGPFPWSYGEGTDVPDRWLYIGTTIWIATLALVLPSIKVAWRDTTGPGRALVLAVSAYLLVYLGAFGGGFYRQRSLIEAAVLILVVCYCPLSPRVALDRVLMWLAVVAAFAMLQSPDLTPSLNDKAIAGLLLVVGAAFSLKGPAFRSAVRRGGLPRLWRSRDS